MTTSTIDTDTPVTSSAVVRALRAVAERQLPRVLTQMDRDPDSPTYGCFDRNHWHYKIRDFPSSILQQGVFALEALRRGTLQLDVDASVVTDWTVAAVEALGRQVDRRGAVDEYYPFEGSFPAAAFGLHAAVSILRGWRDDAPQLLERIDFEPFRRLARHLAGRFESRASNQQAIALAGLALGLEVPELEIEPEWVETTAGRFFGLQHTEGWFEEYGGPDTGYLAVTLDALVDYRDATRDPRADEALSRAVGFIAGLVGADGRLPSTLNSRNTDYVVPYGLARAAETQPTAAWLLETLFESADGSDHFLAPTDDRYHSHYIYASVVRSLPHLEDATVSVSPTFARDVWLPGAGLWIHRDPAGAWSCVVAAKKGGLVRVHRRDTTPRLDHGWRLRSGSRLWTTNWWNPDLEIVKDDGALLVAGRATSVRPFVPSPGRHVVLRALSWLGRERIVPLLKKLLIFRSARRGPSFARRVEVDESGVLVVDHLAAGGEVVAETSPRQNLRHVASADSFSVEDLRIEGLDGERREWRSRDPVRQRWAAAGSP